MAVRTVVKVSMGLSGDTYSGTVDALLAAELTESFTCGDPKKTWVEYNNGSGSSVNVTILAPTSRKCDEGHLHNVLVAVGAGVRKKIPVDAKCVDPTTGLVSLTLSLATTVTMNVFELADPARG